MEKFCNEAYHSFFKTLADKTRLEIIDVLSEKPKTVQEISTAIKQAPALTSKHLEQLVECALLHSEKSGNELLYSLNMEILEPIGNILAFHTAKYCPGLKECIPQDKLKDYLKKDASKETYIEHE
ncbi:MAG: metalloregulator ArsR/SmtB family transcription factor [Candidatus Bathyarchaeota archaeon]|nr:metalloregulator ArsR/SmtB family transcription factor [Candidatus Bathyarchaeota archaeon]